MKQTKDILSILRKQNIKLSINGDNIEVISYGNKLSSEQVNLIKKHKEELTKYLKKAEEAKTISLIPSVAFSESYPVSDAQRRIWILSQSEAGSIAYNMPFHTTLRITNVSLFISSVNKVLDRHEILRTVFKQDSQGDLRQWILNRDDLGFELTVEDFRNNRTSVSSYVASDSVVGFDLEKGPLLRAGLLQVSEDEYVFYYNLHHIISDGWSMDVLSRDVMQYYNSGLSGQSPELPSLRIQYKDYTVWQLSELSGDSYKSHQDYWLSRLSSDLPVVDFAVMGARPPVRGYQGAGLLGLIPESVVSGLKTFVSLEGGSLFMFILASLKVLLHRYTSAEDLILGTPVAGRDHMDLEDQIGFYINILALRSQLSSKECFKDFYVRLKGETLDAFEHQSYPFDRLLEDLDLRRDMSRNPLYDILLDYHVLSEPRKSRISSGEVRSLSVASVKHDLEFHLTEVLDGLEVQVNYNSELYNFSFIERFFGHFQVLLKSIVKEGGSDSLIGDLDYLGETGLSDLLSFSGSQDTIEVSGSSILDLFREQVSSTPDLAALLYQKKSYSYRELDLISDQLAVCLLSDYKVNKGDIISLKQDRNDWLVISILGILKSGCAYLPLPKDISSDRESYILEDSGSRLLLTDSSRMFDYTNYEGTIFALDVEFESDRYDSSQLDEISLESSDLAYVIYTSGSTGVPKGVLIEHGSLLNYSYWARSYYLGGDIHSFGLFTPLSFDLTVTSLFLPLLSGGSLRVYPDSSDVSGLLRAYIEGGLSVIKLTPAHVMLLGVMDLKAPTLKIAIVGGDELQQQHIDILLSINKDIIIYNEYGPTEATVGCTVSRIISGVLIDIGKPISNTEVLILDGNNNLVAPGISGELCVSGPCLARGYLNREALMAEKFQAHPYKEGTRLYKTGDVGYWLPDGRIVYQGRKDGQIKIRGYRVELGEISHQLMTHPQIDDCVIDTLPNEGSDIDLVAYIVSDTSITSQELRNYLSRKLPEYMLPHYYVVIEDIPLTSNGKVDRSALPEVTSASLSSGVDYLAPVTTEERALVFVCEQVLKREGIGVSDNFYNLGGDSIKSIQISSRLRQQGYTLKVGDILATPVLSSLALCMVHGTREIDQSLSEGSVDLTPIQHFFFASDDIVVKSHYNQSVLLRSEDSLSRDALSHSISDLVKHHDALRLVYMYSEGLWKQSFKEFSSDSYSIEYYDLRDSEDELSALKDLGEALQGSFDLEEGPLFKVGHFRLSDGDRLALIAHHLMVDGVSWRILLEDLSILYEGYNAGNRVELALKTDSFQRWSRQQVLYAKSSEMSNERMYWEGILNESLVSLPVDMAGSQTGVLDRQLSFILSSGDTNLLQTEVHGVYGTEINDILLTGLGLALREVFGIDTSVLKMEGHGREDILSDIDISRTVGWFTSVYPHVLSVGSGDLRSVLVDVKEGLRQVPNKGIGYGMLKYQSEEGFDQDVRMDIGFNYLGDFGSGVEGREEESENPMMFAYSGDSIGASIAIENEDDILLSVTGMMVSGQLKMTVNYSSSIYKDTTINSLVSSYQEHLTVLIEELSSETKHYLTPSDLTFKGLTNQELEVINTDGQLEDVYELSPAQKGMYYHWLTSESSSLYFMQWSYRLNWNGLSKELIGEAYNEIVNRYDILRTSFSSKYADNLLQIVKKEVSIDFLYKELDRNTEIDVFTYVAEQKLWDREQGFDLESGSQMRLIVLDLGSDTYEFIWSHHHILMDGWCVSILINEFYQILQSKIHRTTIDLPFPKPYSDYIKWLSDVGEETSLSYWKEYLSGYDSVAKIPSKVVDSIENRYDHRVEEVKIEGELFEKLKVLCGELGVTQSTFIQSAWGYLLSRYNGTRDVVFGTVVSGRPSDLEGVEDMVGLFMNTIPVRVSYQKEDKVEDLLRRAQASAIEGTPHHYVSLARVQAQSDLGKDLLDHIMVFENFPIQELIEKDIERIDGGSNNRVEIEELNVIEQMNYNFDITIFPSPSSLLIKFQYNANIFDSEVVVRLSKHFFNLLDTFVNESKKLLAEIEILSENEQLQLIKEFDETQVLYPVEKTILDLFYDQVIKVPLSDAVIYKDKVLNYQELDTLSNQLADYLVKEHGIKEGSFVGVHLDRNEWYVVSILGILKAGGAYVPIDTSYPSERKKYILEDSGVDLLITDTNYMFEIDYHNVSIMAIDVEFEASEYNLEFNQSVSVSNPAYVIYTSGSTGAPKGVLIEHKAIKNTILSQIDIFELNKCKRSLQFASFSFDASVSEIFITLLSGAGLYIVDDTIKKDPKLLGDYIFDHEIDIATLPPSYLKIMDMAQLKNMKVLITAGEPPAFDKTMTYLSYGGVYCNAYGPTEVSICGSVFKMTSKTILDSKVIPIGKPISNVSMYILDKHQKMVPMGITGEICIGGPGLAKEYINKPDMTTEKFIDNPYIKGERLYKTGDLGRRLPDGQIEFLGRIDDQVKIRGYRVELGEIEYQLKSKQDIKQAIVIVNSKGKKEKELVAYIVSDTSITSQELRDYLSRKLPEYMLPHYYVAIDEIPLTSNGKVDRSALLGVTSASLSTGVDFQVPVTAEERALVFVCEQVLKREGIGVSDNFYNLGGDSIKSIQISSRLRQQGYTLKVGDILATPVLSSLALCMKHVIQEIDQSLSEGSVDLTPIQHFFFASDDIVVKSHYNQSVLLRSEDSLSRDALSHSISDLVKHHDALRLVYMYSEGLWKQSFKEFSSDSYSIEYYDLRDSEDELSALKDLGEALQGSFDLEEGPLFKVGHFRLSDGDRLALIAHHLMVDGVSWRILLEDLSILYEGYNAGNRVELALKTDSFQRWSGQQVLYAKSSEMSNERMYWEGILNESLVSLPVDMAGSQTGVLDRQLSFILSSGDTNLLQTEVHGVYGTEINDILLTGLGLALREVFGIDTSVLKMEGHGREDILSDIDISRTVGWFTSVYPHVLSVGSGDLRSVLVDVKEGLRQVPNKGIGYGMLKYQSEEGFDQDVRMDIGFNYLGDFGSGVEGREEESENPMMFTYATESIGRNFDKKNGDDILLSVTGMMVSGQLKMSIGYSTSTYKDATINSLVSSYQEHLTVLIEELSSETKHYLTPSDLTFKGLTNQELEVINTDGQLEDVYELSPLQEGIYYHWLLDKKSPLYFEQVSYRLQAPDLKMENVEKAYNELVTLHAALRTHFTNDYVGIPLQVVSKKVSVGFSCEKLEQRLDKSEILNYILRKKEEDRKQGFDLESGSQMRLKVLDLENGEYEFIWSHHHIIMDGWCAGILIKDFYKLLEGINKNKPVQISKPARYSTYIQWLNQRVEKSNSINFWKNYLTGYKDQPRLPFINSFIEQESYQRGDYDFFISKEQYTIMVELCKQLHITHNTFLMTLWGILITRYNDVKDIVFGSIVSGRPEELKGIENMVGLFANTIPIRISYEEKDTVASILKKVQQETVEAKSFHYSSISDVQLQSPLGKDLIDHLLVFSNYPIENVVEDGVEDTNNNVIQVNEVQSFEQTNYNFHVDLVPLIDRVKICFVYNKTRFGENSMLILEDMFKKTLEEMLMKTNTPVVSLEIETTNSLEIEESNNLDMLFEENF